MNAVVTDASAVVDYLLRIPGAPDLNALVLDPDATVHVPAWCDIEVTASLRRRLLADELSERRAHEELLDFLDLPLTRHGHTPLLARMLELRHNFSASDAAYVALAQALDGKLLAKDRPLACAARIYVRVA